MRLRVIMPIVIVLVLVLALVGVVISNNVSSSVMQSTDAQMVQSLNTIQGQFDVAAQTERDSRAEMDAKNLSLVRALAQLLADDPSVLTTERIRSETLRLGASEAYVTDATGIVRWSSAASSVNMDITHSPQTQMFASILGNSGLELAQTPQRRADGELYQYVAVSRVGERGIVVLGFSLRSLDAVLTRLDPQTVIEGELMGVNGGVFVLDANYNVVADSARLYLNTNVADLSWSKQLSEEQSATFEFEYGTTQVYAKSLRYDDKIIIAYVPVNELEGYRVTPILTVALIGGLGIIILAFLVFFILSRVVLRPLDEIAVQAEELQNGQRINVQSLRKNSEAAILGHAVNEMLDRVEQRAASPLDKGQEESFSEGEVAISTEVMNKTASEPELPVEKITAATAATAAPAALAPATPVDELAAETVSVSDVRYQPRHTRFDYDYADENKYLYESATPAQPQPQPQFQPQPQPAVSAPDAQQTSGMPLPEAVVMQPVPVAQAPKQAAVAYYYQAPETSQASATKQEPSVPPESLAQPEPAAPPAQPEPAAPPVQLEAVAPLEAPKAPAVHFQLDQVFHRAVAFVRPQFQKKALHFTVLLDKTMPNELLGDQRQLSVSLMKMLAGAVVTTPEHGRVECIVKQIDANRGFFSMRIIVRSSDSQGREVKSDSHNFRVSEAEGS